MLAEDTSTMQEAEQLLITKYGPDYIVVNRDAERIEEHSSLILKPQH
jgi:hypothetical protein